MTSELIALMAGEEVGRVTRHARGRLTFTYAEAWRESTSGYPLSLSMPLAAREHGPDVVAAFLWGLLPDNEMVLERWARKFQVSARNVFALIEHVGEDCAGAVQFVRPDRLAAIQSGAEDGIDWLDEADLAARLKALREDHAAWRMPRDVGQFSLAGAQPKTAVLHVQGKWGIPRGRIATTHILKPPTGAFDGHAENEHLCLRIARKLGMPTASTEVLQARGEVAIAVERYDRIFSGKDIVRVHQEDVCQALGLPPTRKYQNEGGPGVAEVANLIRLYSSARDEDVGRFVDAVLFDFLIAGPDAHAKNYSLLIGASARIRLAPLYDIASILPYDDYDLHKVKLSMKVGGEYGLLDIRRRHIERMAKDAKLSPEAVLARFKDLAQRLPDAASEAAAQAAEAGLTSHVIERLVSRLVKRARACLALCDDPSS
ncbi:MAG: serine/threonine protein kinase [Phenylobacterium zucineum]|nr:MAG: serine/threonine protein kinase [Phenylobacterium zucineum]